MLWRKTFPEALTGGWGSVVNSVDDAQLRGLPSWLPSASFPFVSLWKRTNFVFRRARIKATSQNFYSKLKSSPLQCLASIGCVSGCTALLCCCTQAPSWRLPAESPWPWAMRVLGPHGHGENRWEHSVSVGHWVRKRERFFVPWYYISLGLGWTRCFSKRINQLSKPLWAFDMFTP